MPDLKELFGKHLERIRAHVPLPQREEAYRLSSAKRLYLETRWPRERLKETTQRQTIRIWAGTPLAEAVARDKQVAEQPIKLSEIVEFVSRGGRRSIVKFVRSLQTMGQSDEMLRAVYEAFVRVRESDYRHPDKSSDKPSPTETLLGRARRLDEAGRTDAALDLIYDFADDLMQKGKYARLDSVLANTSPDDLSVDLLLGLLTATLPVRNQLPSRASFFAEVERVLKHRGEHEDGLLVGLEG